MGRVLFTRPLVAHAEELAFTIQPADREELVAFGEQSTYRALLRSVSLSAHAWTALLDRRVLAMFGVCWTSTLTGDATLWLLTSTLVDAHRKTFVVAARRALDELKTQWPRLRVGIDFHHNRAIRFAASSGFTVGPIAAHRVTGAPVTNVSLGA